MTPPLRRPWEKLGGCAWLPRFIDKCRLRAAGALPPDYQLPFCHPLAVDGHFLAHFGLAADAAVTAASAPLDEPVLAWFVAQPGVTAETIATWNDLAPNLGRAGFPGAPGFAWARRHFYAACTDPRVDSAFTAIAWDEGFLDELLPR